MSRLRRGGRRSPLGIAWLLLWAPLLALPGGAQDGSEPVDAVSRRGTVHLVTIRGSINPASSDYLQRAIQQAEVEDAAALLLELDTPGGLVASTKDIIQAMLGSPVPIIVYVAPAGAWAGSAGTFITMAGHVAAMAPGSSIGAASPVGIGGGSPGGEGEEEGKESASERKAQNMLSAFIESIAAQRNRNVEWAKQAVREAVAVTAEQAVELNVVDFVAADRQELYERAGERTFELSGETVRLELVGAPVKEVPMSLVTRVLNVIVDPNVAVILFLAGLLGLYIEFNQPGLIVPGAIGAVCLFLALVAMQVLPFSWIGLALMLAGIGLFLAEVFFTSYGLLFAGGVICLLIGGSMLFDRPEVSDLDVSFWPVLVPAVAGMALFGAIVVFAVGRSLGLRQQSGTDELVGLIGTATTILAPTGTVFVRGEYWRARAPDAVDEGARVEIVGVEGLELEVRPVESEA